MDPPQEEIGPLNGGPLNQLLLKGGPYSPLKKENNVGTPLTEFSGSVHVLSYVLSYVSCRLVVVEVK